MNVNEQGKMLSKSSLKPISVCPAKTVFCVAPGHFHQITVEKAYLVEDDKRGVRSLIAICPEHSEPIRIEG